ncbi:energy-coupling factor transport system ATP-binding protein [Fusibacter tunisiensis]|uniref:Energy-coupling factor transport system ATP-binding protein n=2 Tax=Fusibacter tunisiensis TaxID=1008308 RepID=A0ABS2MR26_9FIRM|nr:energy-coupling factor transporter ATPase [Fusibacter tunisiensis]MBM7561826.1 energy-coupling factor transport system ATP-binding protein [Fusibacter tunisiensis]
MIVTENLYFRYADEKDENCFALKNVNIKIKDGEFVVIIGHNGSGKSTLSKLLNGIYYPTQGKIFIDQLDTSDESLIWEIRKRAGMVFQNPDNQLVATIVEEDVAFGPENMGLSSAEIRLRVDEALDSVSMGDFKRKPPHHLSGGQKQRVAIAGILAMKPKCIIFDEPTAMLDPSGRKEVMETIRYLNAHDRMTVVHITHFMDEAVHADRILVMDEGEIVLEGTPKEVFSQVDTLKSIGLDVPQVTLLSYELKKIGFDLSGENLTVEELVEELCQLK